MQKTFKFIKDPVPCNRVEGVYVVNRKSDLTNTVLHQLQHPDEIPVFLIGSMEIPLPDISTFSLEEAELYNDKAELVYTTVELHDLLRALDTYFGSVKASRAIGGTPKKPLKLLLNYLSREIADKVEHFHSDQLGFMGFCLNMELPKNSIGISLKQAEKIVKFLLRTGEHADLLEYLTNRVDVLDSNPLSKGYIRSLAYALDGVSAWMIRYPNASSSSVGQKTIRVIIGAPAEAIYISAEELISHYQGDADGDRMMGLINPMDTSFTDFSNPLHWKNSYHESFGTIDLDEIALDPYKSPSELVAAFSQRGEWVGKLTYYSWILYYTMSRYYKELGANSREEMNPVVLDLLTPLIEGVMNARKATGSGLTKSGETLAKGVCDMLTGQVEYETVLKQLPVLSPGEVNEEKFSEEQINLLRYTLKLVANGKEKADITSSSTGGTYDPVILAKAGRFSSTCVEYLLGEVGDQSLYSTVRGSLLSKSVLPWKNGPVSLAKLYQETGETNADF